MSDESAAPKLKVPLGLKPSMGPTYDSLLRRSRRRLQLLHSGQDKLEYLTDEQYLRGARLIVEEDQYFLAMPIQDPPQGDLIGYLPPSPSLSTDNIDRRAAGRSGVESIEQTNSRLSFSPDSSTGEPLDLGAALDALLRGNESGEVVGAPELDCVMADIPPNVVVLAGVSTPSSLAPEIKANEGEKSLAGRLLAPAESSRLMVDQTLNCIEGSSSMLRQVVEVLQTSSNVIGDVRALERQTGLTSGPARNYIAAREPEFVVDIDGYRVPFSAPAVRTEMAGQDVVRILVQLLQTKAESDVLRVSVSSAEGAGIPGGVSTLGWHEVRFVGLADWQRGVLLILRGAGLTFRLGVSEGISTARLERKPALVVDPCDWMELKRTAMEALASAGLPVAAEGGGPNQVEPDGLDVNDVEAA